jgi:hypothetical protein
VSLVDDFFAPWEKVIESFDEMNEVLMSLFDKWVTQGRQFAWRGVVDASRPLHSSLYRRLLWTSKSREAPNEETLCQKEREILTLVHRWGLHNSEHGRLSILAQLATLQHFGAPTRLIDVTLNAYIGLWFAVEEKFHEGLPAYSDTDGRLFAVDITNRLINEDDERRCWEDSLEKPWKNLPDTEWFKQAWAWRPPALEARIAAQNGAFLLGGVPQTPFRRWPKEPRAGGGWWAIDEVRRCTSIPLRMHKAEPKAGGVSTKSGQPAYTFRITAKAKRDIRERLTNVFGYSHSTIYPDYPGFADYGTPDLRKSPP